MTLILSGKYLAGTIKAEIKQEVMRIAQQDGIKPTLHSIIMGNCQASLKYAVQKDKLFSELGMKAVLHELPESYGEEGLAELITRLNLDENIQGIMIHYPLPQQLNQEKTSLLIDPLKDIEGINPYSHFQPCTAKAVIRLLDGYNLVIAGKKAVVIGRSKIVGKPVAEMLLARDATVSICHSKTNKDTLDYLCQKAEIIVTATGKLGLITSEMVNSEAVIIDAGTSYRNGKVQGDVEYYEVLGKVKALSPVPGGVGPLTNLMAAENLILTYEQLKKNK